MGISRTNHILEWIAVAAVSLFMAGYIVSMQIASAQTTDVRTVYKVPAACGDALSNAEHLRTLSYDMFDTQLTAIDLVISDSAAWLFRSTQETWDNYANRYQRTEKRFDANRVACSLFSDSE